IGVRGVPGARDEYDSYLPQIFKQLLERAGREAIAEHLVQIEERSMGLTPSPEHAAEIAEILEQHREWILEG
ncbi:MAG: hypothetical protein AAF488_17600, partial [Planctomycetota bacterium]